LALSISDYQRNRHGRAGNASGNSCIDLHHAGHLAWRAASVENAGVNASDRHRNRQQWLRQWRRGRFPVHSWRRSLPLASREQRHNAPRGGGMTAAIYRAILVKCNCLSSARRIGGEKAGNRGGQRHLKGSRCLALAGDGNFRACARDLVRNDRHHGCRQGIDHGRSDSIEFDACEFQGRDLR